MSHRTTTRKAAVRLSSLALAATTLASPAVTTATAQGSAPATPATPTARAKTPADSVPGVTLSHFDRSVRPQDDFYRYVNGTWLKTTKLPADKASYGAFTVLRDLSDERLRTIIEAAAAQSSAPAGSDARKIGDYYRAYMDTARIEQLGIAPVKPELERVRALRSAAELPGLLAHLQRIGVSGPYGIGVQQDLRDPTRYVAYVGQSGLGLP
ncbi:MAG TPA: M13 family metallopeptidase N-terminal domain-containing protein, partial [Gemmatimonadaceae bacterium]|nr:M13 family metallopeptidase N-terminal domain-containing protein [Gemmatimonadaceae bacterium]